MSKLKAPSITFWTAWADRVLLGCGALKELTPEHGEVKSMRTPQARRGQGAGRALLEHIVRVAKDRNYGLLSLETGSQDAFIPAQKLYQSFGFTRCGPFGNYKEDPNSVFMSLRLPTPGGYPSVETKLSAQGRSFAETELAVSATFWSSNR